MRVAMSYLSADQFEDTKVVIRFRTSQTAQWSKEKGQKNKQGSANICYVHFDPKKIEFYINLFFTDI
jgi:hypothetical protein